LKNKTEQDEILKQALELDDTQRAQFITQINDSELRNRIEAVIFDQKTITQYFDQNNTTNKSNENHQSNELKSGSKINRITIEKLLGKGGMGSVYQGYDEKLKRKVAIKSIRSECLKNESTHKRFIREAQILSKINHPAICHIYDYIETEKRDYLVLELIKGKQLNQVFLDYDDLLEVFLELAKALEAAHKHGIVHRDLKPDNIMITNEKKVKVLDFGIAQSLSNPQTLTSKAIDKNHTELTQQGSLIGTIRYMSPEQARGEKITTASDIYSLGIIIQEAYSHERAYESMETGLLLDSVQKGKIIEFDCTYKPINKLIQKLCQLDPQARPTATDLCLDIENILGAPKIRKKRSLQFIGLLLIMTLFIVMGWQWRQSQFQNNSAELAKTYTNSINQLVRESEQIYVLPLHNTKPEIEHVLLIGAELYTKINDDPLLTEKDKIQLHGLIYLESEAYEIAVDFLERSEASDSVLARAWVGLYIDKASEYSEKYGISKALQDTELRQNYLTPAIKYIDSTSQKDPIHQAFKIALTDSLDAGIVLLNKIILAQSWDKKAIRLKTQLLLTQAQKALQSGDWAAAKQYYEQTIQTFEQAIDMARSYPKSYLGLCQVNNTMLYDGIQRTGQNIDFHARKAIQACENNLIAEPNNMFALNLLSRIHIIMAQGQMMQNISPLQTIETAEKWNKQSEIIDNNYMTLFTTALIHSIKASYALTTGQLDNVDIDQAIAFYKKAILNAPGMQIFLNSGLIYAYAIKSDLLARNNDDMSSIIKDVEFILEQSLNYPQILISEKRDLYLNIGSVYFVQLGEDYLDDKDITSQGKKLLEIYDQATNKLLDEPSVQLNIANVHLLLAQSQINDPQKVLEHLVLAKFSLDKVQKINAKNRQLLTSQLWLQSLTSHMNNDNFSGVEIQFEKTNNAYPNNTQLYYLWANHYYLKAQLTGNPIEKNLLKEEGLLKIQQALSFDPTNKFYLNLKKKLSTETVNI
jgi:serine/threonine protein kinase